MENQKQTELPKFDTIEIDDRTFKCIRNNSGVIEYLVCTEFLSEDCLSHGEYGHYFAGYKYEKDANTTVK